MVAIDLGNVDGERSRLVMGQIRLIGIVPVGGTEHAGVVVTTTDATFPEPMTATIDGDAIGESRIEFLLTPESLPNVLDDRAPFGGVRDGDNVTRFEDCVHGDNCIRFSRKSSPTGIDRMGLELAED